MSISLHSTSNIDIDIIRIPNEHWCVREVDTIKGDQCVRTIEVKVGFVFGTRKYENVQALFYVYRKKLWLKIHIVGFGILNLDPTGNDYMWTYTILQTDNGAKILNAFHKEVF